MGSIPALGHHIERLVQIKGAMPRLTDIPAGCAFNPRCPKALDRCRRERPELTPVGSSHVACWLYQEEAAAHA
jgi:peptide/nickel transport system ATP-binding protein